MTRRAQCYSFITRAIEEHGCTEVRRLWELDADTGMLSLLLECRQSTAIAGQVPWFHGVQLLGRRILDAFGRAPDVRDESDLRALVGDAEIDAIIGGKS